MILHNMTCADKIPKQCIDCILLNQCRELGCIKRSPCKSRTVEQNDVSEELNELRQKL